MGILIDILFEIASAIFFFSDKPRRGDAIPLWLWWCIRTCFLMIILGAAVGIIYLLAAGTYGQKVPIGRIEHIEGSLVCNNCSWFKVKTSKAQIRVESSKGYAKGDEVYLTRTRSSGLQICSVSGCWKAQIEEATDEIKEDISTWPKLSDQSSKEIE